MLDEKTTTGPRARRAMKSADCLPTAAAFRTWLMRSLLDLDLTPTAVGQSVGLGKNTLHDFINGPDRDLRLATARAVQVHLLEVARARGVDLRGFDGGRT